VCFLPDKGFSMKMRIVQQATALARAFSHERCAKIENFFGFRR
jgi:hypothetical protein